MLRNCEEVGLFDDLKHVNPFDETFRQAINCKDKQCNYTTFPIRPLGRLVNNDDDTLHTPNILPRIISNATNIHNSTAHDCKIDHSTIIDCSSADHKQRKSIKKVPKIVPNHSNQIKEKKLLRKICPKPNAIPTATYAIDPIKEHIKDSLIRLRSTDRGNDNSKTIDATVDRLVQIAPSNQPTIAGNLYHKSVTKLISTPKVNAPKSSDIVERNREAAKRYRNKQKIQHEEILRRNTQLEDENMRLRRELQLMKKAHANCMVTTLENQKAAKM